MSRPRVVGAVRGARLPCASGEEDFEEQQGVGEGFEEFGGAGVAGAEGGEAFAEVDGGDQEVGGGGGDGDGEHGRDLHDG